MYLGKDQICKGMICLLVMIDLCGLPLVVKLLPSHLLSQVCGWFVLLLRRHITLFLERDYLTNTVRSEVSLFYTSVYTNVRLPYMYITRAGLVGCNLMS